MERLGAPSATDGFISAAICFPDFKAREAIFL